MSNISLCMIALNEAETLPGCLAAAAGLYDELIVVVDSRTTDATARIAQSFGAKVLSLEYVAPGHKGKARQMGIDAASGDWIVVLDADETITDPVRLRSVLLAAPKSTGGMNVHFANVDDQGRRVLEWYQKRCFRRERYRYIHREHEIPVACVADPGPDGYVDVTFEHRPPAAREPLKMQPMLERLMLDVAEHPDDPHSLYMCARQHGLAGNNDQAVALLERYLTLPNANMKADAARVAGICCNQAGNRRGFYEWMHRATAYEPARRLLWVELAEMYHDDGAYVLALALARMAAELPMIHQQRETLPKEQLDHICRLIEACRAHYHAH